MKRTAILVTAFAISAIGGFAQTPAITGVVSSATNIPSGLPNSGIAQGAFFTVYGSNLGPATAAASPAPFQTAYSGSSVSVVVGSNAAVSALIVFTYAGQINAVLPSTTPLGTGTVTVTYNSATSTTSPITVVASNFGAFTLNGYGTGPAAAQDYTQTYALTTLRATAKPGDTEILYGTGLGANPGGDQNQTYPFSSQTDLRVSSTNPKGITFALYIGGVQATVGYAGRSADVALDQINFTIPSGVTGCYVPVIAVVGGIVSNSSSISIDTNGAVCSDPFGLTSTEISTAATGQLSVASILLTRLSLNIGVATPITEDTAAARFYDFNGATYGTSPEHAPDFISLSSFGSCQITNCSNTATCVPSSQALALPHLNAGTSLQIAGSGVSTVTVPADSSGFYTAALGSFPLPLPGFPTPATSFLQPGTFTVTGSGGPDINAFTASVAVPAILPWTSSPAITSTGTLSRSQPLTVNWTGVSDPSYVLISVSSATNVGTIPSGQYNAATVTCLQKGSAGTFTIPTYLLSGLPASSKVQYIPGLNLDGAAVLVGYSTSAARSPAMRM